MPLAESIKNFLHKFSMNVKELEEKADDVLQLTEDYKLFRIDGKAIIIGPKNKIVFNKQDFFPKSPARAAFEAIKKLEQMKLVTKKSSKEIWTCGFRDAEERWVWYKNSEPKMTVSFKEAFKDQTLEDKFQFHSINYGCSVISSIKTEGIEKAAKEINALVLESPYTKIACSKCKCEDNYTIDDLVDENKQAKYDANFVVCSGCNELVKLI
jgi:hypothetical protein